MSFRPVRGFVHVCLEAPCLMAAIELPMAVSVGLRITHIRLWKAQGIGMSLRFGVVTSLQYSFTP